MESEDSGHSESASNLVQLLCAMQRSLLTWCNVQIRDGSSFGHGVATSLITDCKCTSYFPEIKERKRDESDDGSQRSESQLEQWQNRNLCTRGRVHSLERAFSSSFDVALFGKLICVFCFFKCKTAKYVSQVLSVKRV